MAESTHATASCRVGCHYYAELFAQVPELRVCWLSAPISPWHRLGCSDATEYARRLAIHRRPLQIRGNLLQYVPWTLLPVTNAPILRSRWALEHSLTFTCPRLRRLLASLGFDSADVLLVSHVQMAGMTRLLPHQRLVYRMTDRYGQFPSAPRSLAAAQRRLLEQAAAIVTTAHVLAGELPEHLRAKTVVVPNGVDLDAFVQSQPLPGLLAEIPEPRVAYVGAVEAWFEAAWVAAAARAMPDAQFVIAGPVRMNLDELAVLPNVHLLGPVDHGVVPALLQHCHAGMVPFADTPLVQAVSPIKVYEYLAAGLPVVSRDWQELELSRLPIARVRTQDDFIAALKVAIAQGRRSPLSADATWPPDLAACSWRARFGQLRQACGL